MAGWNFFESGRSWLVKRKRLRSGPVLPSERLHCPVFERLLINFGLAQTFEIRYYCTAAQLYWYRTSTRTSVYWYGHTRLQNNARVFDAHASLTSQ